MQSIWKIRDEIGLRVKRSYFSHLSLYYVIGFYIFYLEFLNRAQSSKSLRTKIPRFLVFWMTACMKIFLRVGWCTFVCWKIQRSVAQAVLQTLLGDPKASSKQKCRVSVFLETDLLGKMSALAHQAFLQRIKGLEEFFFKKRLSFELHRRNTKLKSKNLKLRGW